MRLLILASVGAALLFGAIAAIPFFPTGDRAVERTVLAITAKTERGGHIQLFYDDGSGLSEANSVMLPLPPVTEARELRFKLPARRLIAFRLDPIKGDATVTFSNPRIVTESGEVVRQLRLGDFTAPWDIANLSLADGTLRAEPKPGANDPQLLVSLDPPLELAASPGIVAFRYATYAIGFAAGIVSLLAFVQWVPGVGVRCQRAANWCAGHPQSTVAIVAAAAAIVANYPVVFLGRSYTSPNLVGPLLLYEAPPTLPGYADTVLEDPMGSDVGALPWHHHPLSIIQHRALFRDGELPLWNRYDNGGVPLLGQGQSMFGDPLHVLPILANGAAWAWDIKYVLARWLFCCALGLIVWRLTRHAPAALISAFSAAFIGFFLFRVNHPAQFSMCYAPSILLAWVCLQQANNRRAIAGSVAGLVLAGGAEINSGTAKEAYMLLICMNATGALLVLCGESTWIEKLRRLAWGTAAGVVFVCLSSPVWVTFLDALGKSYTSYNTPSALQILPTMILGLFDELFYRPIHAREYVWNPSANFLVLGGVLYLFATWRRSGPDRARLALLLGAAPAFLLAFGIFPPEWIVRIPFVANIAHIDNTFSCVLIVHLIVLAGMGYRMAAERLRGPDGRGDLLTAAALAAVPILLWLAVTHTVHREPFGANTVKKFLRWGEHLPVTDFVWANFVALPGALLILALIWWRVQQRGRWTAASAITALACVTVLLWRHGQHRQTNFDKYVFNPAVRVDFHAKSPAIEYVLANRPEPVRTIGLGSNLFPGWSGAYDLESTGGPDAVVSPLYRELIDGAGLERLWDWVVFPPVKNLPRERKVYDFLNVRYYVDLHHKPEDITPTLEHVFSGDLNVYASPHVWPRAFFTDRVATYQSPKDLGALILQGDGRPFAAMQQGQEIPAGLGSDLAERAVVAGTNWKVTNNTISFTVRASGPGLVVLQENWFEGDFRVTLDGRPAPCLRVNHAFKGVAIPAAGEYRVEFAYWPRRFTLTLVLAAFGAALLGGVLWWGLRREPSKSAGPVA
jgi:hypothetical protein